MVRAVLSVILVFTGISCLNTTRNDLIEEEPINAKLLDHIIKCNAIHFSLPSIDTLVSNGIWAGTNKKQDTINNFYTFRSAGNKKHKRSYGKSINYYELYTKPETAAA